MAKNNKYAHFNEPQKDLDFHWLDQLMLATDYEKYTLSNLTKFKKEWFKVVRLIVWKGNHSKNWAVIKPIVQKYLRWLKILWFITSYDYDKAWISGQNTWAFIVKF